MEIPFNRPRLVGGESEYVNEALSSGKLSGNGIFAQRCGDWLERHIGSVRVFITPSCTAALEMTALLIGLEPGDEVIVPDFAFVSTANAFALRGAVPVFVDVQPDTLNIDPDAIEAAITERTRAIVLVHYGGIACEMDRITAIARRHHLTVVEDAAHSIGASYRGRPLGSLGELATLSFHETKNIQCGEGGALLINDASYVQRAEIIQEKGTDRSRFFRGEVDKYTWRDIGSSYLLSEVGAAFLWAQLQHFEQITAERIAIWERYYDGFELEEHDGLLRRPIVPSDCAHSGHLFYLLLATPASRDAMIESLGRCGIHSVFHYLPLHDSPGGRRFGRLPGPVPVTDDISARLLRLPLWSGLGEERIAKIVGAVQSAARSVTTRA